MPVLESASLLTAADYQRLTPEPGLGPRYQLVDGELLTKAASNFFHQEVLLSLCIAIEPYLRRNRVGFLHVSPIDVYLDNHNVFQPDLVYVSREREAIRVREGIRGAPDLAIEILSPSTAALDRWQKRRLYAQAGTSELWLIDPERRTVELFELARDTENPTTVLAFEAGKDAFVETSRLPNLRIALSEIFYSP